MQNTTIVRYLPFGAQQALEIPVVYEMDTTGNMVSIRRGVHMPSAQLPSWLKPYEFRLFASYRGDICQLHTNDARSAYSVDAARFISKVQEEILLIEKREGTYLENSGSIF